MTYASKRFALFCVLLFSVLTALILPGCGGSNGGTQETNGFQFVATPVQAQIQLPTGETVPALTLLEPWCSGGATPLTADGKTNVTIYNNGPQYADIRDAAGNLVLISYLSDTQKVFNAETTAQAMIFFAIGGAAQIDEGPAIVLAGISDFPGYGSVVDEISAQLVSQGYISLQTGTLTDKIQDVVDAVRGTPTPDGRGTIAEPTNASGIFLDTIIDGQFTIQQNFLRRTEGAIRRVSYVDSVGIKHEGEEAKTEFKDVEIKTPSRYGGFLGTAANILKGDLVWTPTVTEPIKIPLFPEEAQATTYELRVYGWGATAGNVVSLTPDEREKILTLSLKSIVLDACLPVVANIIIPLKQGAVQNFLDFAGSSSLLSDTINILRETNPQIVDQIIAGDTAGALLTAWETMLSSNTFLPTIFELAFDWANKHNIKLLGSTGSELSKIVGQRLALLGVVDVFFSSADMLVYSHDIANSGRCQNFFITTTPGKVSVTGKSRTVSDKGELEAVIQNKNPDAVYKYEWSVEEGYVITAPNGSTATAPNGVLATSHASVEIESLEDEPGFASVECKVTRIDGEFDIFIAVGKHDFEFVPEMVVTPESAQLGEEEDVTIKAEYEGDEEVRYRFQYDRSDLGTWTNGNVVDIHNTSKFTANGQPGLVTVNVYMFFVENGVERTIDSAVVTIQCGTISGTRVYPHTINDTGIDQNDDFWGRAQTYILVSKSLGTGTVVIYRNGEPFRTFDSEEGPSHSQYFFSAFWPASQYNHVVEVETRWQDGFLTDNEAESWGRQQATILFGLYMTFPNNIYTVQVQPN